VEEGPAQAVGGPGPVGRADHRRAGAGADGFVAASYWDLEGSFETEPPDAGGFTATLVAVDGTRVASGKDFDAAGAVAKGADRVVLDAKSAAVLADEFRRPSTSPSAASKRKPYRRSPYPPFRTSTLQQEAGTQAAVRGAPHHVGRPALYENGYITYMRTDSTTLSETALDAARTLVGERYGADYLPTPRTYESKVRTPRRRTRRSAPPATPSPRSTRWRRPWDRAATRRASTSWSGSGPSPPR
jgi:DNA topoisomerase IA